MPIASIAEILQDNLLQIDVEFGNAGGFFSASKSGLQIASVAQGDISSNYEAQIPNATVSINDSSIINEYSLTRSTQFIAKSNSDLFDIVSRFVVLSDDRSARIAGNVIQHKSKNIYHQYSTKDVLVPVGTEGFLRFEDNNSTGHMNFDNVFYVRDESIEANKMKRWIVHHRMIVNQVSAHLIIRCCHPIFNSPLPWQNIYPNALKRKLFRIREIKYPNFPFMAVGESAVSIGHVFDIGTSVSLLDG
jgi:hypothetical protein